MLGAVFFLHIFGDFLPTHRGAQLSRSLRILLNTALNFHWTWQNVFWGFLHICQAQLKLGSGSKNCWDYQWEQREVKTIMLPFFPIKNHYFKDHRI